MKEKIIAIITNTLVFIIILFSYVLAFTMNWVFKKFGNIGLEEIMFQISVPLTNANNDYYYDYTLNVLPYILICTAITLIIVFSIFKKRKKIFPKRMKGTESKSTELMVYKRHKINWKIIGKLISSFLVLALCITYTINRTDLITYINHIKLDSNFIKEEYVDPNSANIKFPEVKRNLIYIYLESMEATFYSKEMGGAFEESLIKELEELAKENITFSNSDIYNNLYSLPGSTWTVGALTAQIFGIPLKIPVDVNSYGEYTNFLPGVIGLGDILKKNNYNQIFAIGSKAEFGGRDHLFKQHGDYNIFDFTKAVEEGKKRGEDFVWWGFTDRDLFEYSKEKITELSAEDKPFNYTMLTVDTHTVNGYFCDDCEEQYEEPYYNVLACSSRKVCEFVEWIQEQDFYENTTIVICGDHPSMQPETFDEIMAKGYKRSVLNIIINPAVEPESTVNKYGSTMDMFPTTLASLGVEITGNKLGLGTNLFSNEKTLIAKYGLNYVEDV